MNLLSLVDSVKIYFNFTVMILLILILVALAVEASDPSDYYQVIIGGIQIEILDENNTTVGLCSTGFPAYKYVPAYPPQAPRCIVGFITAGHCVEEGYLIYQPTSDNEAYYRGTVEIDPDNYAGTRSTDSAFVGTEVIEPCFIGDINPDTVSGELLYYGQVIEILGYIELTEDDVDDHIIVHKTGRATGTTYGRFMDIRPFQVEDIDNETINITHGIVVELTSGSGDSGGVGYIVEVISGKPYAWVVGVLNGREVVWYDVIIVEFAYFSRYNDIEYDLGVSALG